VQSAAAAISTHGPGAARQREREQRDERDRAEPSEEQVAQVGGERGRREAQLVQRHVPHVEVEPRADLPRQQRVAAAREQGDADREDHHPAAIVERETHQRGGEEPRGLLLHHERGRERQRRTEGAHHAGSEAQEREAGEHQEHRERVGTTHVELPADGAVAGECQTGSRDSKRPALGFGAHDARHDQHGAECRGDRDQTRLPEVSVEELGRHRDEGREAGHHRKRDEPQRRLDVERLQLGDPERVLHEHAFDRIELERIEQPAHREEHEHDGGARGENPHQRAEDSDRHESPSWSGAPSDGVSRDRLAAQLCPLRHRPESGGT
jgi:hypothetical protein